MKNGEYKEGDSIVRVAGWNAGVDRYSLHDSNHDIPGNYIRAELKHILEPENWPVGSIVHSSYHNEDAIYYGRSQNGSLHLKYDGASRGWYSVGSYSLVRLPSAWLNAESEPEVDPLMGTFRSQLSVQAKNDLQRSMNKLATDALRQAFGLGERRAMPAPKSGMERLGHVLDFASMTCKVCGNSTDFIAHRNLVCPSASKPADNTGKLSREDLSRIFGPAKTTKINARLLEHEESYKSREACRKTRKIYFPGNPEPDPWEYRETVSHLNTPKMYTDEAIGDAIDATLERATFEAWPYADNTLRHGIV